MKLYFCDLYVFSFWPELFATNCLHNPKIQPVFFRRLPLRLRTSGGREILCRLCGGHLGHVFMDGQSLGASEPERHCVNSAAVEYVARGESGGV